MSRYIHKDIESVSENEAFKSLDVKLINGQIIRIPFEVIYLDNNLESQRQRFSMYFESEYKKLRSEFKDFKFNFWKQYVVTI